MPRVPDLLHRFLPAGAPGAAGAAAVPIDRVAVETAELAQLFAELAATESECDAIISHARDEAAAAVRDAAGRANEIAETADQRTAAELAEAIGRARAGLRTDAADQLAAAHAQAAELRDHASAQIPEYVTRAVGAVVDLIHAAGPAGTP